VSYRAVHFHRHQSASLEAEQMPVDVNVNFQPDQEVLARLEALNTKLDLFQETIMATVEEFKAVLDTIDTSVTAVKADTEGLLAKLAAIPTPGMTPEQQAAIDAAVVQAQSIADRLGAIDASVP
jgi:hypothetical protein